MGDNVGRKDVLVTLFCWVGEALKPETLLGAWDDELTGFLVVPLVDEAVGEADKGAIVG
jgi:hypothetical protein